jgi:hypothetical protein
MKCFTFYFFYRCPSLIAVHNTIWFHGANDCLLMMSAQRFSLSGSERHLYLTVLEISNQNLNLMLLQVRCSITPFHDAAD